MLAIHKYRIFAKIFLGDKKFLAFAIEFEAKSIDLFVIEKFVEYGMKSKIDAASCRKKLPVKAT